MEKGPPSYDQQGGGNPPAYPEQGQYSGGSGQYPQSQGQYPQGQYPSGQATYMSPASGQPLGQQSAHVVVVNTNTQTVPGQDPGPTPCSYTVNLVFAILSFFSGCLLLAIPAIICASLALCNYRKDPQSAKCNCYAGMGLTIASFVCTLVVVAIMASTGAIIGSISNQQYPG